MAYFTLSIAAPTLSAYDPDNPTQATEELNLQLHNILQDMEDGSWYLSDEVYTAAEGTYFRQYAHYVCQTVFNYAKSAIVAYRSETPIPLTEPTYNSFSPPSGMVCKFLQQKAFDMFTQGMKMLYFIYYMWKTEEDPVRIKDYIRDMLLAWPLQDISIDLKDEGGSQLRVYPTWNELET